MYSDHILLMKDLTRPSQRGSSHLLGRFYSHRPYIRYSAQTYSTLYSTHLYCQKQSQLPVKLALFLLHFMNSQHKQYYSEESLPKARKQKSKIHQAFYHQKVQEMDLRADSGRSTKHFQLKDLPTL